MWVLLVLWLLWSFDRFACAPVLQRCSYNKLLSRPVFLPICGSRKLNATCWVVSGWTSRLLCANICVVVTSFSRCSHLFHVFQNFVRLSYVLCVAATRHCEWHGASALLFFSNCSRSVVYIGGDSVFVTAAVSRSSASAVKLHSQAVAGMSSAHAVAASSTLVALFPTGAVASVSNYAYGKRSQDVVRL